MEKQYNKIYCPECRKPIKKDFTICPYCRNEIKKEKEEFYNPETAKEPAKVKICPICKMNIPKEAMVCPYCRSELGTAANVGKILSAVGTILIVCVTIPIILFSCGMCSLGSF
jgi:RNA polymerase subunit RPABC4/transcription elongation factor Spt4